MPVISRIWARSALISAGLQPQQETGTRATGQRNWPTHPAVPPGTDDQNSTPARELEPPQPLLRSLDGGQHPCAKIGAKGRAQGVGKRWASLVDGAGCEPQCLGGPPVPVCARNGERRGSTARGAARKAENGPAALTVP